jgi:hypothetical protein
MSVGFDACWAVDWSGARAGYRGVAVARARAGTPIVEAVPPPAGLANWTRTALVARLAAEIGGGGRILVGFDFAFGFARGSRAALRLEPGWSLREVWAEVDRRCAGDPDLYGGAFAARAAPGAYWRGGRRPADWHEGLRRVDLRAREAAGVRPESVLKLVGAKQVGLASLAGMRALHALTDAAGPLLAAWPGAVRPRQSVVVEIFPTLFRREALGGVAKIRDATTLARALDRWQARLAPEVDARGGGSISDDLTDALVSAAALRHLAEAPDALAEPRDRDAAREGWIFGVPS